MKAIIYGSGSFAEYVSYVISHDSKYEISAFCVEREFLVLTKKLNGMPVIDFETVEQRYPPTEYQLFIAVGNNEVRKRIFYKSKKKGYTLLSYISSKATFWDDLKYGENVFVGEASVIHPFVTIGDNSIIIGSKIGHHSTIGKHNLLSGCFLAGSVSVSEGCFIGLNSTVKQNILLRKNTIIGMNCVINSNTNNNEIYYQKGATRLSSLDAIQFQNSYLK